MTITETNLKPLSVEDADYFRNVCTLACYRHEEVVELTGLLAPPPQERFPGTLHAVLSQAIQTEFGCLTSWFYCGIAIEKAAAESVVNRRFIEICLDCGLLVEEGDSFTPTALVIPVENAFLASDKQVLNQHDDEFYVPTLCDAALNLSAFSLRSPAGRTLDLCSGFALHGILACRFSDQVVATDLNPRAKVFCEFNAALNRCDNLLAVTGDRFAAVEGTFDRILANPPFIISPDSTTTFRHTPMMLDGFVQQMLREAPAYLNEGGVLQVICEWVEIQGQPWQERLEAWFDDSGCDVWILPANRQAPRTYTQSVLEQSCSDSTELSQRQVEWESFFAEHHVKAIHGGFILMRRRSGDNWRDVTQLTQALHTQVSDAISDGLAVRDMVFSKGTEDELWATAPRVVDGIRQVEESHWKGFRWRTDSVVLHTENGLPVSVGVDEYIRKLVEMFDGRRTVKEAVQAFSEEIGIPFDAGKQQGLQIVQSMLRNGILKLPPTRR